MKVSKKVLKARQQEFVSALADMLVAEQAKMGIMLSMDDAVAKRWARLRNSTNMFGYPTLEEGAEHLNRWLQATWMPPVKKSKKR